MDHPGLYLKAMIYREVFTHVAFAKTMGLKVGQIQDVIQGKRKFPEWLCVDLEKIGFHDRYWWANMCRRYEVSVADKKWQETIKFWEKQEAYGKDNRPLHP